MPAPRRVSTAELVAAVRTIAERDGLDAVTMSAVAAAVGVRAPSLYKRAANRHELLRLAADDAVAELTAEVSALAAAIEDPREVLSGVARALRALAGRSPTVITLLFGAPAPQAGPSPEGVVPLMNVLLDSVGAIAPADRLSAARTLTAWAYGFCMMEQNGGFRQGGDVDAAFDRGLEIVLRGIGG
ncbi:TetR-like C-terminal domain-containing protein [Microbacterium hydrocarbonoxydans]|uniref:TetR-like C-terminal domain-containing protein n=1 Tax=Microbacterium hydrocarbonoxydans TaxID=273678 RepID=UPI0007BB33BA|nr:TetR-like C-terminal domain-containing protein [Microbacterium hydrocarbonoxydans]GAT73844.1 TetR family transcriptional regulator [Microbacterium sp. HM58-2]